MRPSTDERRDQILQAATTQFSHSGFQKTDVQQIADAIKVGKGTIYRYFPTKEALFFATVDRAMGQVEAYIRDVVEHEKDDLLRLKRAVTAYIEFFRAHPDLIELFVQERAEFRFRKSSTYFTNGEKRREAWRQILERLYVQGRLKVAQIDLVIDTLTHLLYGIMFTNIFHEKAAQDKTCEGLDMVMYGIFSR